MRLSEDVLSIIVTLLPAGNARALLTLSKCLHDIALPQAVSSICVSKADNLVAMCQYFAGNSRHDHIRTLEIQSGALVQEHVEAENAYNCAQVMECLHEFFQKATNVTRLTLGSAELIFHDGCKSQIGHAIASLRYLSTLSLLDVGPQTISTLNELPLSIKALEMSAPEPFYTYGDWSWIRDLKPIPSVQRLRLTHFFVLSFTSLTPVSGCAWPNALCLEIGENRVPCSVYPRFFPNARCFHLGHSGIECLGEHKEADKWRNMGRITTSLEQIYEWDISERTQLVEFVDRAGCGAKWLQDMSSIVGRLSPVVLRVTISSPEELFCRQGIPVQPSKSWAQIFAYGPRLKSIELVLAEGCGRIQEYQDHSCSLSRDDCWQLVGPDKILASSQVECLQICYQSGRFGRLVCLPQDSSSTESESGRLLQCLARHIPSLKYVSIAEVHSFPTLLPDLPTIDTSRHDCLGLTYGEVLWWRIADIHGERGLNRISIQDGEAARRTIVESAICEYYP